MADSTPAPEPTVTADSNAVANQPESDTRPAQPDPSSASLLQFPNPNPSGAPPPSLLTPPLPIHPSFRPAGQPVPVPSTGATPQFSPVTYQTPGVPPPGVAVASASAVGSGPQPQVQVHPGLAPPYAGAGQPLRYGLPLPNGYPVIPHPVPQGALPPVSHD